MIARELSNRFFSTQNNQIHLSSFADGLVKMDHTFDTILAKLYSCLDFTESTVRRCNPSPHNEKKFFDYNDKKHKQEMLIRNFLLLSRLFIRNAKIMELPNYFSDKEHINILDLGCGNAFNLMGILALFGINRVNYLGVDILDCRIEENNMVYKNLKKIANINFIAQEAKDFLLEPKYQNQFDLVLIQHPNFEFLDTRSIFHEMFLLSNKVIAQAGILYSTFYMRTEADYFTNTTLPLMPEMQNCRPIYCDAFNDESKIHSQSDDPVASENYIFISPPFSPTLIEDRSNTHTSPKLNGKI